MKIVNSMRDESVAKALLDGQLVVLRTDTLYGIIARADDEQAIARLYQTKDRSEHKSPIVLVSSVEQLYDTPPSETRELCEQQWPGAVSIIVPSTQAPGWIRRGNASVAYRLPDHPELRSLVDTVGRIAAPSANPEGETPARNVQEAIGYFGDNVAVYVDGGEVASAAASKILRVDEKGNVEQLR